MKNYAHLLKKKIIQIYEWLKELFRDKSEYQVFIWYVYEEIEPKDGSKVIRRKCREYQMKDILKKSNTHIIGKNMDGKKVEIKAVSPFDYEIHRIR